MHDPQGLSGPERVPLDRLLSRILIAEPDARLEEALRESGLLGSLEPGAGGLDLEAHREEFARLFLLPGGTPPFASAWLAGERERLGAQLTGLVRDVMAGLGREPRSAPPWGNLPLDHLALLLDLSAGAFASSDPADRALGAHLTREAITPWVGSFAGALESQARLPLYVMTGRLLRELHGCPS